MLFGDSFDTFLIRLVIDEGDEAIIIGNGFLDITIGLGFGDFLITVVTFDNFDNGTIAIRVLSSVRMRC